MPDETNKKHAETWRVLRIATLDDEARLVPSKVGARIFNRVARRVLGHRLDIEARCPKRTVE